MPPAPKEDDEPKDIKLFEPQELSPEDKVEPVPPKDKKEPTSAIRKELEKVAADKKAAEAEIERLKQEISQRDNTHKEFETKLVETSKELDSYRSREALGDPFKMPEIQQITTSYNQGLNALAQEMDDMGVDTAGFHNWMTQAVQNYAKLDPTSDTYKDEVAKIRSEASQFGTEFLPHVMKAVRSGAENRKKVIELINTAQSDIPNHIYKQQLGIYQTAVSEFEPEEREIFNPPDDIKQNDPLNQSVILRAMIDGSEEVKKAAQTCLAFTKYVALPVKPVDPTAVDDPAKLNELATNNVRKHNEHFKKMRKLLPEALLARAVLPSLWKSHQDLLSQLENLRKQTPKPKLNGEHHEEVDEQAIPIREFSPVDNPDLVAVSTKRY